jgi:nucleoporin NUP159
MSARPTMWGTNGANSRFGNLNGFGSNGENGPNTAFGSGNAFGSNTAFGSNSAFGSTGALGANAPFGSTANQFGTAPLGANNGAYEGNVLPPSAYEGYANPGLAYANSQGYSRFSPNYAENAAGYVNGAMSPYYGGYSPYYGNNGGNGLNESPSVNNVPMNYGTGYVPQNYGYGIGIYPPSGPGVGNMGTPNPVTTGSYPATELAPAAGIYGWF